jgi:hypothetical protein
MMSCNSRNDGSNVLGPGRYCSPRHMTSFNSRTEGSNVLGLADIARHVIRCWSTQETRVPRYQGVADINRHVVGRLLARVMTVHMSVDDAASTVWQTLPHTPLARAPPPGGRVSENKHWTDIGASLAFRVNARTDARTLFLDAASVEGLFSIAPLPRGEAQTPRI